MHGRDEKSCEIFSHATKDLTINRWFIVRIVQIWRFLWVDQIVDYICIGTTTNLIVIVGKAILIAILRHVIPPQL